MVGARAFAHHSFAATYLEDETVTIEGELVQFLFRNPHSFVHVMVKEKDGTMARYAVEWGGTGQLGGQGVTKRHSSRETWSWSVAVRAGTRSTRGPPDYTAAAEGTASSGASAGRGGRLASAPRRGELRTELKGGSSRTCLFLRIRPDPGSLIRLAPLRGVALPPSSPTASPSAECSRVHAKTSSLSAAAPPAGSRWRDRPPGASHRDRRPIGRRSDRRGATWNLGAADRRTRPIVATALPSSSISTSTRPSDPRSSSRIRHAPRAAGIAREGGIRLALVVLDGEPGRRQRCGRVALSIGPFTGQADDFPVVGDGPAVAPVHVPLLERVTTRRMSRISFASRPRNAVEYAIGGHHGGGGTALADTAIHLARPRSASSWLSNAAKRSGHRRRLRTSAGRRQLAVAAVEPDDAERREPGISNSDAKPCCVFVPSWCGMNERRPRPAIVTRVGEAAGCRPRFAASVTCSQLRGERPVGRGGCTEGTSAQLTNQSVPDATVSAPDQPFAVRSANLSVAVSPDCSVQLARTPRDDDVSCGARLPAAAGVAIGWTDTVQSAGLTVRPQVIDIAAAKTSKANVKATRRGPRCLRCGCLKTTSS